MPTKRSSATIDGSAQENATKKPRCELKGKKAVVIKHNPFIKKETTEIDEQVKTLNTLYNTLVRNKGSSEEDLKTSKKIKKEEFKSKKVEKNPKEVIEIMELLKGNMMKFIFKHDCSRVLEAVLKYSTKETHSIILDELKSNILELIKSKYGKWVVMKLMLYYPDSRNVVFEKVLPQTVRYSYI